MTTTTPAPVLSMTGVSKRFGAVQALNGHRVQRRGRGGGGARGRQRRRQIHARQGHRRRLHARRGRGGLRRHRRRDRLARARPRSSASPPSSRTSRCATTSTSSATSSSGSEVVRTAAPSTRSTMEKESWRLLRELSAKIPSVRIPVASLSGGQRQTVAIARSLLGKPKVVMLDEPTAALGVAQTAEVLNLVERLRENGLAVILISHNMSDVHGGRRPRRRAAARAQQRRVPRQPTPTCRRSSPPSPARPTNAVSARAARKAPQEEQS